MIPGSANALLLATAAAEGGYQIERSLRFNSSDSAYLSRTPASAGNRKTWTWAGWVKRSGLGAFQDIWGNGDASALNGFLFRFDSGDKIDMYDLSGSVQWRKVTSQVFRDTSAWYHFVISYDTTNGTAGDRVRLYVNGERITAFSSSSDPSLNYDGYINNTNLHAIGRTGQYNGLYLSGYLADIHFIDGQALDPTSFTEVDATTGQLVPKAYTGSYGTNGFHLPFSDNSTAAALGTDTSGNSNTWTVNNISVAAGAGNDSLVDSPTNFGEDTGVGGEVVGNYCTWNPLASNVNATAVNGNLQYVAGASTDWQSMMSTIGVSSGKWYCEVTANVDGTGGKAWFIGVAASEYPVGTANYFPGITANSWGYYGNNGNKYNNNAASAYGASYTTNNIIGIAIDLDNGKLFFSKNGTWQASGDPVAGTNAAYTNLTGTIHVAIAAKSTGSATLNAGQRPFAYTAPSGFKALCTTNLPAPVVAKPNTVFDVKLWTGTGSSQTISGYEFSPDLVWIKSRNNAGSNALLDTVRGASLVLRSDATAAETNNTSVFTSFNSNGFTLGADTVNGWTNFSSWTYVGWSWDAGSSTVTNTQGSITSQVRANASAGFSIVTYTGDGSSSSTVGHALGVVPELVIIKGRQTTNGWSVHHKSLTSGYVVQLNSTSAEFANSATAGGGTGTPTSSVITFDSGTVGVDNVNKSGNTFVAYCFAPVAGYSSFGSYVGNGSASDGPFVYTGFRPRWILVKRTSGSGNWILWDTVRQTFNVNDVLLLPDSSGAEFANSSYGIDVVSNGFKLRGSGPSANASAATYVYAAFAESPFQYARAR